MSNFDFLSEWPELEENAKKAEANVNADPRSSCFYSRYTMERMVKWMYEFDDWLASNKPKYDNSLQTLVSETEFKRSLGRAVFPKIKSVQKQGNDAVHSERKINPPDSTYVLKELHHILYWFYRTYTGQSPVIDQVFDLRKIPLTVQIDANLVMNSAKKIKVLEKQLIERDQANQKALEAERLKNRELQAAFNALQAQVGMQKASNVQFFQTHKDPHDYNEAETRKHLIDQYLIEAGWNLNDANVKEYAVGGMPKTSRNPTGNGRVDYVLWGADGKPLAVVEAKKTTLDAKDGKRQAELYADCLQNDPKFGGQRPLIYYTNGYEIFLWDDSQYDEREVQGFMTRDQMQRLIDRRALAKPLNSVEIDTNIAAKGRPYQRLAIESVCEQFDLHKERKSLLVMATGTGKTRTTIALVDLLMRAGWVKNILFLADRNALVSQAKKEFSKLLPKCSPEILTSATSALKGRLYLSTYPTMMNLLAEPAHSRLFGVGHFDLVVVDEAHRSVYKKYRYIFDYFDALMLGLTATPKSEIDFNTYDVFGLQDKNPTFAYELQEAIDDGFLVPPKDVRVALGFVDRGVKYNKLKGEEKAQWEEKEQLADKEEVLPAEVNKFLFNEDTVDKALAILWENGIKAKGGDHLGKTIIFAANNDHANFIVDRFNANFKKFKGKFARVITYKEAYAETLIDEFKGEKKSLDSNAPLNIAVSVDMLDTGIDVPEVVNLMFFKAVKSKVKFLQMLGRGTRLCESLFGPDDHKDHFKVFDCCRNFEFFELYPDGAVGANATTMYQKTFEKRLMLAQLLKQQGSDDAFAESFSDYLLKILHHRVAGMNLENFMVRPVRKVVEKFQNKATWSNLDNELLAQLQRLVAPLPSDAEALNDDEQEGELAERFDLMILSMQQYLAQSRPLSDYLKGKLTSLAAALERKQDVPQVAQHSQWLAYVQSENFWTDLTIEDLEQTRLKLRLLMIYIDKNSVKPVYTNFQDTLLEVKENPGVYQFSKDENLALYRKRVESYIRSHEDDLTIARIKRNLPITKLDLQQLDDKLFEASGITDKAVYLDTIHPDKSIGEFIRELVGLDRGAAKAVFADYLDEARFNTQQIHFVNTIIEYLTQNGVMQPGILAKPPFSDIHFEGVFGIFDDGAVMDIRDRIKAVTARAVGE